METCIATSNNDKLAFFCVDKGPQSLKAKTMDFVLHLSPLAVARESQFCVMTQLCVRCVWVSDVVNPHTILTLQLVLTTLWPQQGV